MKRDNSSRKKGAKSGGGSDERAPVSKQRSVRRCPFVASAEVTDISSETKISARTSELGMGGCYIETLNPLPEGSMVKVLIVRDQGVFESKATVVYSQTNSGMGLAFAKPLPQPQRAILEDWLAEIVVQFRSSS
jgi:PilZ domain